MDLPVSLSHGVLISYANIGVLITGASGIGKSDCALELLHMGGKLICDDAPQFRVKKEQIIGFCQEQFTGVMHIRGLGFIHIPSLLGSHAVQAEVALNLIIDLQLAAQDSAIPKTAAEMNSLAMLEYEPVFYQNHEIARLRMIQSPARPMGVLLSTAIKQFKLRMNNNDPCQKLI